MSIRGIYLQQKCVYMFYSMTSNIHFKKMGAISHMYVLHAIHVSVNLTRIFHTKTILGVCHDSACSK